MPIYTSHHSKFPVELYDLIIDEVAASNSRFLYSNSNPTLRACLSVSRSFHHRACHHLFSGIRIDEDNAPLSYPHINPVMEVEMTPQMIHDQLKHLVDIMQPAGLTQESPCAYGIRPYIRDVYFGLRAAGAFDDDSDLAHSEIARQSRVYALSILEMLHNPPSVPGSGPLKSFAICGRGSDMGPRWHTMPSTVRSSLLDLIRHTEGLSLKVNWLFPIPKHILRGTMVSSLDFGDGSIYETGPHCISFDLEDFPEYDDEAGIALLPLPCLDSATIRDPECFPAFYDGMYPKDPAGQTQRTLNKLAVELLRFDDWFYLKEIAEQFPDLKILTIFTEGFLPPNDGENDPDDLPGNPFDIRGLSSLQRLEVSMNCQFKRQIRSRDMWERDITPHLTQPLTMKCPGSYALLVLIPFMSRILRSCANDSVSELWLSFRELAIRQRWNPAANAVAYDLDSKTAFCQLDMLLGGGGGGGTSLISNHSVSSPNTSASNLFPSLRRCVIDIDISRDAIPNVYYLKDPPQINLVLEVARKRLEDYIRDAFPRLGAPSSKIVLDLRVTFGH